MKKMLRNGLAALAFFGLLTAPSAFCGPIIGRDPVKSGTFQERTAEILPFWLVAGFSGLPLVNVASDDCLAPIEPERLEKIKKAKAAGVITPALADKPKYARLFGEEDFVRAAFDLGVVSEVYWVAPQAFLKGKDAKSGLSDYLLKRGFSEKSAASFLPFEGCLKGDADGIPLTVCSQEALPDISGPALVNIESSFFTSAALERKIKFSKELRNFFALLAKQEYEAAHVSVSYAVHGGKLPQALRWIAESVQEVLMEPSIIDSSQTPSRWLVLENSFILLDTGKSFEAAEKVADYLTMVDKNDQCARSIFAQALLAGSKVNEAFNLNIEACKGDKGYCFNLVDGGLRLIDAGEVDLGLVFLRKADELAPWMEYRDDARGALLLHVGLWGEALAFYKTLATRDGAWPNELFAALAATRLGQIDEAVTRFSTAVDNLDPKARYTVFQPLLREAVEEGVAALKSVKMDQKAEKLDKDEGLRKYAGR